MDVYTGRRPMTGRLRDRQRMLRSFRIDPVLLRQVQAALEPHGIPFMELMERLMVWFLRTAVTSEDVRTLLDGLPTADEYLTEPKTRKRKAAAHGTQG